MAVEKGEVLTGTVTGITSFGAFVKLPGGENGLVHISEVSVSYVKDINDVLKIGDEVKVLVTEINEQGRISLSIKKASSDFSDNKPAKPAQKPARPVQKRPYKDLSKPNTPAEKGPQSFEDMMSSFLQSSNEKQSALKRSTEFKSKSRRK